jgi:hypothetical protein
MRFIQLPTVIVAALVFIPQAMASPTPNPLANTPVIDTRAVACGPGNNITKDAYHTCLDEEAQNCKRRQRYRIETTRG